MNKARRQTLNKAVDLLTSLKNANGLETALNNANKALELVEDAKGDEEYAYDSLPESFQDSYRGEVMEDNIADLEDAICDLEVVVATIEEQKTYDYEEIRKDINSSVNSINNAILR